MRRVAIVAVVLSFLSSSQVAASDPVPMRSEDLKPGVLCRIDTKPRPDGFAREAWERYRGRVLEANETEVLIEGHCFAEHKCTKPLLERIPVIGSYFKQGASLGGPKRELRVAVSDIEAIFHQPPDDRPKKTLHASK